MSNSNYRSSSRSVVGISPKSGQYYEPMFLGARLAKVKFGLATLGSVTLA
jgi:hypothetical protein